VLFVEKLERLWSLRSLALFVVFACSATSAVYLVWEVVEVFRTSREKDFFSATRGCCGLVAALAVGLRHAYPLEALPYAPKAWGLQCQHLPVCFVAVASICGCLGPPWLLPEWPFAPLALFFAWLHLRYLMWFPHAKAYGDHSPDFCFASLFPLALRPVVSAIGAIVHNFVATFAAGMVRIRQPEDEADRAEVGNAIMYDPSQAQDGTVLWNISGGMSLAPASSSAPWPAPPAWQASGAGTPLPGAPGSKEYDARRAKALKLLDEGISSLLAPSSSFPEPAPVAEPPVPGDSSAAVADTAAPSQASEEAPRPQSAAEDAPVLLEASQGISDEL